MKKILLYTDTPQVGGAELQMFLLAKFLNKERFTPILACSNYPALNKWVENFEQEGIKVIRINVLHKHDPRHYFQLKRIIANEKIDILHAHVWNPGSCRYAYSAASSAKIPIVITEHDPFKLSFIKDFFKKHGLKKVSKIITVSENNGEILRKLYPKFRSKIEVIHNGIDVTWWQSQLLRLTDEERVHIKKEHFNASENTLIIVTVAELHERKGLKFLIEAMEEVVKENADVKLVIIGEGKQRGELESLIRKLYLGEHVILLGKQKGIPKLLKNSDIFVLPSIREAFGLVLTETMITSLPIIATKVGGIPEIIENGKSGILVKPENSKEIAKALKDLIKNPSKREKLAAAGQQKVLEKFSASIMAEKYEETYNKILKYS